MASVNCNNPCNAGCTNFMEHLALRLLNDRDLADRFDSIDNRGEELCQRRTNPQGIRNRLVFGKWRNTDEEPVCATPIRFNAIIDDFVRDGGQSLILIGQSQGGAKLAGMVRDHWRWGNTLTLELLALWDADLVRRCRSFSPGTPLIGSMGVRRVGEPPAAHAQLLPVQQPSPVPERRAAAGSRGAIRPRRLLLAQRDRPEPVRPPQDRRCREGCPHGPARPSAPLSPSGKRRRRDGRRRQAGSVG